ncbi:MAG: MFS transporter [Erysipelotrichaceae bacterium]|jgi:predicted MFS family arabinose efflux permease|nr:MFS transporter [Erysipelotrichaceae bacterium]
MKLILSNRNYRLHLSGQLITVFGSRILRMAFALHVLDVTKRADLFASMLAIGEIPMLFASLGGVISDRYNRKMLMIVIDTIHAIAALTYGLFFVSHGDISAILVILVLLGLCTCVEEPNGSAIIHSIVEKKDLTNANGLLNGLTNVSHIAGPLLGGVLYATFTVRDLALISAAFFFLAVLVESFIAIPHHPSQNEGNAIKGIWQDLLDGFKLLIQNKAIFHTSLLAAVLNFVVTPFFNSAVPVILRLTLKANDYFYGLGVAVINIGLVVGALGSGMVHEKIKIKQVWLLLTGAGFLLALASAALTPSFLALGFYPVYCWFSFLFLLVSAAFGILNIILISFIQKVTPANMQGKILGSVITISQLANPLGLWLSGLLLQTFQNAIYIPALCSAGMMVLISLAMKQTMRNVED